MIGSGLEASNFFSANYWQAANVAKLAQMKYSENRDFEAYSREIPLLFICDHVMPRTFRLHRLYFYDGVVWRKRLF